MRKSICFLFVIVLIFSSCGKTRIDLISKKSGLKLPEEYNIIENKTENSGIQDYQINIILEFDIEEFSKIIKQTDSLSKVNPYWKKHNKNIIYYNSSDNSEPEEMEINLENRKLHFILNHI